MTLIQEPERDNQPQITMFLPDLEVAIGEDTLPDGACRFCKQIQTGTITCCEITYPDNWYRFWCCLTCKERICAAVERLVKELGI